MQSKFLLAGESLSGRNGHEAGRDLLQRMVLDCTGEDLPEIALSPRGKPYFPGNNLYFSISHTKNHVFCALARQPIGIDAEEIGRAVSPNLAKKILSPRELSQYEAAPDKGKALLTFWVLKEAAAKCSGEGLRGYPNHTDFSLADPRVGEQDGCLVAVILQEDDHAL